MTIRPFCNILLTIWFNEGISFSISISFGAISGDFDIFSLFFDETVWMHMIHQLRCMNFIAEVENGSNRWISTMKFKGANHDGLPQCSPLIGTGRSHAFRSYNRKKNEKLKNHTIFAKDFDMNKLLKFLWRGRKQGRCGRSPMLKIEKYAHIYLVFAHAREISKVCSYRSPWQTV